MLRGKQFVALVFLSLVLGISYSLWFLNRDFGFVNAAYRGDIPAVRSYLAQGVRPDATDAEGMTAIGWAAYHGNENLVRLLLDRGADPQSPMSQATLMGHPKIVIMLMDAGAHLSPYDGELTLRNAAKSGDIHCATLLLHHGVSINCKTDWIGGDGFTPLLMAARYGSWPMFKFLADRGGDTTARASGGETALMLAERSDNPEKVRICSYLRSQLAVAGSRNLVHPSR